MRRVISFVFAILVVLITGALVWRWEAQQAANRKPPRPTPEDIIYVTVPDDVVMVSVDNVLKHVECTDPDTIAVFTDYINTLQLNALDKNYDPTKEVGGYPTTVTFTDVDDKEYSFTFRGNRYFRADDIWYTMDYSQATKLDSIISVLK